LPPRWSSNRHKQHRVNGLADIPLGKHVTRVALW
jgi:hypothetical protein